MAAEKFIKNKTVLIILISACLIVIISLGIRQTFGMFYFDFSTDLGITLSQFGFALGLQMLLWGVFGPWFGVITDKYGGHIAVFIGFIFYNKSKRFVSDFPQVEIPLYIKKVGVFVNETAENILEIVKNHNLDYVQLHGDETPAFCSKLAKNEEVNAGFLESFQLGVIKAFSVDEDFDFSIIEEFEQYCDYFIFDTKGENYGGNGVKFNWEILKNYKGNTPLIHQCLIGGLGV